MKSKTNNRLFFSGGVKTGFFLTLALSEFKRTGEVIINIEGNQ